MAGGDTSGSRYPVSVASIFVFNLIVGVGALALPKAFQTAGLVLGTLFLSLLCFLGYITITFMVEAQAIANAILLKTEGQEKESLINSSNGNSYDSGFSSDTPFVHSINETPSTRKSIFYIKRRVEVSQMALLFLGEWGQRLFFLVMIIYLYGDLAIYAVSVPKSIYTATGDWLHPGNHSLNGTNTGHTDNSLYYIYLSIFSVVLVPFSFFDFQKTRYLQICTLVIRNVSLFGMIIIALIYDIKGEGHAPTSLFNWAGFPEIFGSAIYAFMCHHSLPSIVTPITNQKFVKIMMLFDNIFVLITYVLLCLTALWAFGDVTNPTCSNSPGAPCSIQPLYTLNFSSYDVLPIAKFLVLFPAFTLSSNFPLIAITLRNNLMQLITYRENEMNPQVRKIIFGLISCIPPLGIAFATQDVQTLVSFTGAYAGLGIMFFFPALLVFFARRKYETMATTKEKNFLESPFRHNGWVYLIFVWCVLALGGQIFRQVYAGIK
uniref:Amino acid transporter transmembrane domain-containing protein n=1 Tax=Arcella intermedia TaxID=1963864 RepID=A0A6B2L2M3_9EUKA